MNPRAIRLAAHAVHTANKPDDLAHYLRRLDMDELTDLLIVMARAIVSGETPAQTMTRLGMPDVENPALYRRPAVAARNTYALPESIIAAHAAYVSGERSEWAVKGHRIYDRTRKATHRQNGVAA